ncbi:MAG TPA: membrane protein insertase YidC [Rhizomicrobium sp.]|jgi:YidC/Oxa1 family membrane protein insertase
MNENRNLILAFALSAIVLVGWEYFVAGPQMKAEQAKAAYQAHLHQAAAKPGSAPAAGPQQSAQQVAAQSSTQQSNVGQMSRDQALKVGGPRVAIDTPTVDGSLQLQGARFDDLRLKQYHWTPDPKSPEIVLFSPKGTKLPYFAQYGWAADPAAPVAVPGEATTWKLASGTTLSPGHPVTLSWDNGHGLVFNRTIAVDNEYMFSISDAVANKTGKPVRLFPYAQVVRDGVPDEKHYFSLHEGFVGIINNSLNDPSYDDVKPDQPPQTFNSTGGWLGITDKYWMATLIPAQSETFDGSYHSLVPNGVKTYWAEYHLTGKTIAPGTTLTIDQRLFAGAKKYDLLTDYRDKTNVPRFEMAIDWGWFFFFTKPMFWLLDFFNRVSGNFGIAILLLTVTIRFLFFPIASTQFKSMSRMKKLQPQVEAIKERFAEDKVRQQQEMMELYKREKVNPVSGCLPVFIQIPVFFSLYKVLLVTIEMRHAPFFGWIHDLSSPDPTSFINLFGLLPFSVPTFIPAMISVGIWPILMGGTQWLQSRLNPAPTDPVQARMFAFMPLIFTFMLASFPVGLVIYYTWSNLLGIAQQWFIMSRQGVEIHLFKNLGFGQPAQKMAAAPKTIEGKAKVIAPDDNK